jgi:hypothetical protein
MTGNTSNISITTARVYRASQAHQANQPDGDGLKPELADVGRLGRRLMNKAVQTARGPENALSRVISDHLGPGTDSVPVMSGTWAPYDHVNLQIGLDAWLAGPGRSHDLVGITGFRHRDFGLADLVNGAEDAHGLRVGNVSTVALPSGPDGATRACVRCALYLVSDGETRIAMLLRSPDQHGPNEELTLEVAGTDSDRAGQIVAEVADLAIEHNVYRGQVISFGGEMFGHRRGGALSFLDRPQVTRDQVILDPGLLAGIERQVLGVQQHAGRLRASGQHLKRGVLLYGVPGTGKTHTIRYLISHLRQATVVVLSGPALNMIDAACSVARQLQPSVIVVEDVDLIAEQRGPHHGPHPLLFQLLNEMDGLGADVDVTFLLTTNRADMLEEALAARPGRVDHAAELPVPDAGARRRLVRLYQGQLQLDLSDPDVVITRTDGVTASFLKELLRKAALFAAEDETGETGAPLRVGDTHMGAALDALLDTRNQLTRVLLGGQPRRAPSAQA